jgi:probable phosphoglycerate mutase
VEGRLQGTVDLPIVAVGLKEAMGNVAVVRHLGVRRIVCSTARRAYQTAQVYRALLGLPIYCTQHFRELDHGKWEGRKLTELVLDEESGYAKWLSDPGSIAIPGGSETVQAAQQRAAQALRNVALSFCDESVLVIGHKHINALLMCALLKEPLTRFRSHIVEDTLPHLIVADTIEALCEGETMLSGVRNWSIPGNRCTNVKGADRSVEKSCLSSWWPSGIQPMQLKGEPEDDQDNSDRRR